MENKDPLEILYSLKEYRILSKDVHDIIDEGLYERLAQFTDYGLAKMPEDILKEELAETLAEEIFKKTDDSFIVRKKGSDLKSSYTWFGDITEFDAKMNYEVGTRFFIFTPEQFRKLIFRIYWDLYDKFKRG